MAFTFEKFTAVGKRYSPQLSIRSNGALGISQGALHQSKMTEGTWYVVLYYDRENKALAVRPTRDENEEGAIKLSVRSLERPGDEPALSAFVAAKSFYNFYNIPHSQTISYKATWDAESGMLIAVLSTPDKNEPTTME